MPRISHQPCTPTKRKHIQVLRDQGLTFREVASVTGIPLTTVHDNDKRTRELGSFYASHHRPGRPLLFTPHHTRRAVKAICSGLAKDATDVQRQLFPEFTPQTVGKYLTRAGLPGRVRCKVPYLCPQHITRRLAWAIERKKWTQANWDRVIFTDESKFNIFGSDGRQYCRRGMNEEFLPRNVCQEVKHGGGHVMVWGALTARGTGHLYRIEGNLNAVGLCQIYDRAFLGTLADHWLTVDDVILQQDNDSKHTSKLARRWREENDVSLLPWPACSPDLNMIENAWQELDRRVRARNPLPSHADQMWAALQEEWSRLDITYIRSLFESMPHRIDACIENRGRWTRY